MDDKLKENLTDLFNLIQDFVFIVDKNKKILKVNNFALKKLNYNSVDLINKNFSLLFPQKNQNISLFLDNLDVSDFYLDFDKVFQKIISDEIHNFYTLFVSKNKVLIPVDITIKKILLDNKESYYFYAKKKKLGQTGFE